MQTYQKLTLAFDQYFFDKRVPVLEYFQEGNALHYRWANTLIDFVMPINVEINGLEKRLYPNAEKQSLAIDKYSVVHVKDWQFLIDKKRVQM